MTVRIKRILAWSLFGTGTLVLTFFKHYRGSIIPSPFLIWGAGIVCYIVGIVLLLKVPKVAEDKLHKKMRSLIGELKQNGNKLTVVLDDCEIKENNYIEAQDAYKDKTDLELMLTPNIVMMYNSSKAAATKDKPILQTVAVYKTMYLGKEKTFYSPTIAKDKENLLFKFFAQKTTTIFIDKNNPDNYYFDVEFVDK